MMASNHLDGSRQTDWELFPPHHHEEAGAPSRVIINQVEDVDDNPNEHLFAYESTPRYSHDPRHGDVIWSSAPTTPTQTPSSYLSAFFGNTTRSPESSIMTAIAPARQSLSPSSSPRLPSPPPYTEVQIGPKSPSIGERGENDLSAGTESEDDSAVRRIRPGTKAADMASGPPLVPLAQLDSPFQLQEHLKALYQTYTKAADGANTTPITRDTAMILATSPDGVDRQLWLYELCRFLTMKANNLIIAFFAESPPCSAETCPEMRASEWQYLCAVHEPPKSCCAIDYCCHTLDWATNVLTSPKYFPSRLTLGSETAGGAQTSVRYLTNIFRRVYRIFAHAWFQHRGVFWQVEGSDGLYIFFKTVCDVYNLIGEDNYTVPIEAEGHDLTFENAVSMSAPEQLSILKNNNVASGDRNGLDSSTLAASEQEPTAISTGATTRRHKHTPSVGTNVTTIAEGEEEDHGGQSKQGNIQHEATSQSPPAEEQIPPTAEGSQILSEDAEHAVADAQPSSTDTSSDDTPDETPGENKGPDSNAEVDSSKMQPAEIEVTTKDALEQKVNDPVQEGSSNTADVELREETVPASEDAAT